MITTEQITALLKPIPPRMEIKTNDYPSLVMAYFYENQVGTSNEVAEYTGLCNSTVNKVMRELKDSGKLSLKVAKKQYRNLSGGITTTTYNVYALVDR